MLGPRPVPWPGLKGNTHDAEGFCIAVPGRLFHLYYFNAGKRARVPGNLQYFYLYGESWIHGFCRWRRLAWKSTGDRTCDGRGGGRDGCADGVRGAAESSAGFPLGVRPGHAILRGTRAPGGSDRGDAESFRIERGRPAGFCREAWDQGRSHQGNARFNSKHDPGADPSRGSQIRMAGPRRCRILPRRARPGHGPGLSPSAARTTPPGGGLSPRSGRRSPIRDLPGGQAAPCKIQHQRKPPPLDLPAGP